MNTSATSGNYGAYEFLDELEDIFRRQLELLMQLPLLSPSHRVKRLAPMLLGLKDSSKAILSVRKAQLPSEAYLIGHAFLERLVSFCYYLVIDEVEFDECTDPQIIGEAITNSVKHIKSLSLEDLTDGDVGYKSSGGAVDSSADFSRKVKLIAEESSIKAEAFLIARATVTPTANELFAGSLYGSMSNLGYIDFKEYSTSLEARNRYSRGEFAQLYFVLCLAIHQALTLVAQFQGRDLGAVVSESQEAINKAAKLIEAAKAQDQTFPDSPAGLWESLNPIEAVASNFLEEKFRVFENAIRKCYELGIQAPSLPSERHFAPDMQLAGLFLKRTLNDLRTVWLLVSTGYTSQAATVGASLFEHALTVNYVAGYPDRADELLSYPTGDVPWKVVELSENMAAQYAQLDVEQPSDKGKLHDMTGVVYAAYKYLCKIKHPTLRSAQHDSGSSSIKAGRYAVMAVPDLREKDSPLKAVVVNISLIRCFDAIKHFARALECNEEELAYQDFMARAEEASKESDKAFSVFLESSPLPFGIEDEADKW